MLDVGANPQAPEFSRLGVLYVRHGKAMKGSAPKQRSVLSAFGWATECLEEWIIEIRPALARGRGRCCGPSSAVGVSPRPGDHAGDHRRPEREKLFDQLITRANEVPS